MSRPRSPGAFVWLSAVAGLCALAIMLTAWLSDDAYITLRTIDNVWNGYGLRWNVVERVQSYTHPLWMLVLAGAYGVTREAYFTTIGASLTCAVLTIALLTCGCPPPRRRWRSPASRRLARSWCFPRQVWKTP